MQGPKCAVLLTVLFAFTSCWNGVSRSVTARIFASSGTAEVKERQQSDFRALVTWSAIECGDVIRTGENAFLDVSFLPNVLTHLGSASELAVEELTLGKDGNETEDAMRSRVVRLRLVRGSLILVMARTDDASSSTTVLTPHGKLLIVSNSTISVRVSPEESRVISVSGSVSARTGTAALELHDGEVYKWPSSDSRVVSAEAEAIAMAELTAAIEIRRELFQEADKQMLRSPPWIAQEMR